jgi:hypothetical protein
LKWMIMLVSLTDGLLPQAVGSFEAGVIRNINQFTINPSVIPSVSLIS